MQPVNALGFTDMIDELSGFVNHAEQATTQQVGRASACLLRLQDRLPSMTLEQRLETAETLQLLQQLVARPYSRMGALFSRITGAHALSASVRTSGVYASLSINLGSLQAKLREVSSDPSMVDSDFHRVFSNPSDRSLATRYKRISEVLLGQVNSDLGTALQDVQALERLLLSVGDRTEFLKEHFYTVIQGGNLPIIKAFLEAGASVRDLHYRGDSHSHRDQDVWKSASPAALALLMEHGFSPNPYVHSFFNDINYDARSVEFDPLLLAFERNDNQIAKMILEKRAGKAVYKAVKPLLDLLSAASKWSRDNPLWRTFSQTLDQLYDSGFRYDPREFSSERDLLRTIFRGCRNFNPTDVLQFLSLAKPPFSSQALTAALGKEMGRRRIGPDVIRVLMEFGARTKDVDLRNWDTNNYLSAFYLSDKVDFNTESLVSLAQNSSDVRVSLLLYRPEVYTRAEIYSDPILLRDYLNYHKNVADRYTPSIHVPPFFRLQVADGSYISCNRLVLEKMRVLANISKDETECPVPRVDPQALQLVVDHLEGTRALNFMVMDSELYQKVVHVIDRLDVAGFRVGKHCGRKFIENSTESVPGVSFQALEDTPPDMGIRIGNNTVEAHQLVLKAVSRRLRTMNLERGLDLEALLPTHLRNKLNPELLGKLLHFFHTGDFRYPFTEEQLILLRDICVELEVEDPLVRVLQGYYFDEVMPRLVDSARNEREFFQRNPLALDFLDLSYVTAQQLPVVLSMVDGRHEPRLKLPANATHDQLRAIAQHFGV